MSSKLKDALISRINRALYIWLECTWEHTLDLDGQAVLYEEFGEVTEVPCEGDDHCDYCAHVRYEAANANDYGTMAIEAIKQGDLGKAVEFLEYSQGIELQFGDDPVWGPVSRAAVAVYDLIDYDRGNWAAELLLGDETERAVGSDWVLEFFGEKDGRPYIEQTEIPKRLGY